MRNLFTLLFGLLFCSLGMGQETYVLVELEESAATSLQLLIERGLDADHFIRNKNGKIEAVLPASNLSMLDQEGLSYNVAINDLEAYYARNLTTHSTSLRASCGLTNFDVGAMGGYHTYDQAVAHLDSMHNLYPDLITSKTQIGTTIEGRGIWAVKISDNPNTDESATEPAMYADALTHAREPLSLEVSLYFMWWLLENYESNPEANYLINNREIFLVPVVNPDGYVFNQQIQPNGGGLWRKNRRPDPNGNNCYGIDLNRNYSFGWGSNTGSSSDPCSNTYRGTTSFSEPESQAVRDYIQNINPVIAFSIHSYGNKFLNPLGYLDSVVNYEIYSELAGDFIPDSYFGYGTVKEMLNYTSSGTTRDYFHGEGIYGWTPEVGSSFWDPSSTICDQVEKFLTPLKTIAWASGDYMKVQNANADIAIAGQNFGLEVRLKNIGLTKSAQNVTLNLQVLSNNATVLSQGPPPGTVNPQARISQMYQLQVDPNAGLIDSLTFRIEVSQEGVVTDVDTFTFFTGNQQGLIMEDFESGLQQWTSSGTGVYWDTTFIAQANGDVSIADSRYGNHRADATSILQLDNPVNLNNSHYPKLEFWAKWSIEPDFDFLYVEVKRTDQNTWTTVWGPNADLPNSTAYTGHRGWTREQIDLTPWKSQYINLRFRLTSDILVQGDGFYLDDLRVVDYTEWATGLEDIFPDMKMEVFPNPNNGQFTFMIQTESKREITYSLLDITGRIVVKKQTISLPANNSQSILMNYQNQSPGIYFLRIEDEDKTGMLKVLIK